MVSAPRLCVVIPCYNEEEVLPITSGEFKAEVELLIGKGKISPDSHILFVNDGSRDSTWEVIERLARQSPVFRGMSLSRNRGHQNALLAGLMEARNHCDVTISIDCDGQDDISAMEAMVDAAVNPERFYSRQLISRVSSQYDIYSPDLETRLMAVIDYISGMTDVYALDIYQKINGISLPIV